MNKQVLSRRQMVSLSVAGLGALALGGTFAFADAAPQEEETAEEAVELVRDGMVIDMAGDPCVEAGTVKRVLTVNSVATEMVLMLGGEEAAATLGQGFQYDEGSLNQAMYPNLADLKTFTRDDCTVENVAAIDPDLVLIDVPDTIAALREAGINAAYASVVSPETIMQAIGILGAALGGEAEERADAYAEAYTQAIEEVTEVSADLDDDEKPTVIYLRGIDSTCGADSMPDNWITAVGGVNVAAELGLSGSRVAIDIEAIMDADPDCIVCESPAAYEDLMANEALAELQAVKSGNVHTAPLGPVVWSMGSSEAMLMLYWAANTVNPDLYDYDVPELVRDYFDACYGYEITDEQIEEILNQ
jgi:iron complex transport system substrate-binding protein